MDAISKILHARAERNRQEARDYAAWRRGRRAQLLAQAYAAAANPEIQWSLWESTDA